MFVGMKIFHSNARAYFLVQYKIDIARIIIKNTFILYVLHLLKHYIFNNMFDQTLSSLTLTKPRMQDKKGQRKYSVTVGRVV
jgi:hypothetical protein